MSDSITLPTDLPPKDYEFDIDVEGGLTKTRYKGDFKFSIPNNKRKALADKMRATRRTSFRQP